MRKVSLDVGKLTNGERQKEERARSWLVDIGSPQFFVFKSPIPNLNGTVIYTVLFIQKNH